MIWVALLLAGRLAVCLPGLLECFTAKLFSIVMF